MNAAWTAMGAGALGLMIAGCGTVTLSTRDAGIRQYADSARAAYERRLPADAAALYAKAYDRARLLDLPEEAGRNAYNVALCRMALGQPADARRLLQQARILLDGTRGETARIDVAEAEAARAEGRANEAALLAGAALERGAAGDDRLQAELLLGELSADKGEGAAARRHYRQATGRVTGTTPAVLRARMEGLGARLVGMAAVKGDEAFFLERKAGWQRAAGQYGPMAESLDQAAAAHRKAGRPERAFECWARAAQSLAAGGNRELARQAAERAAQLTRELGDPSYAARMAILMGEPER